MLNAVEKCFNVLKLLLFANNIKIKTFTVNDFVFFKLNHGCFFSSFGVS